MSIIHRVALSLTMLMVAPTPALAVTRCAVLDRAQAWVDAGVMYSYSAWYTDPTTGSGPYRTDCSGYVSATWGLSPPGHTTYSLGGGVWDSGQSYLISASDLQPGDALNYPGSPSAGTGHVMLYVSGDFWSGVVTVYEEYSSGHPATYRSRTIDTSIYQPIRFVDIEECCVESVELCNGVDDDCDGETDEDWPELGTSCTEGLGVCEASGTYVCSAYGSSRCDAVPSVPSSETCDGAGGLDDDCDGEVDEDADTEEICNGIDDDCDGETDEDNVCFVYRPMFADFDGNDCADVLLQGSSSEHGTLLLLADGAGGFRDVESITTQFSMTAGNWSAASRDLVTGDFNGDGNADLIMQGLLRDHGTLLLLADGRGGFQDAQSVTTQYGMTAGYWSANARNLNTGDFDGDGNTDIVLQGKNSTEGTLLLLADGSGGFEDVRSITNEFGMSAGSWGGGARYLFTGDFNGDGYSDILLQGATSTDGSMLLLADGLGGFEDAQSVTTQYGMSAGYWSASSRLLYVGYFDTDGKADILLQGATGSDGTLLLRGAEHGFEDAQSITSRFGMSAPSWSAESRRFAGGDYDGDGVTDVLLQGRTGTDGTLLLLADGAGGFHDVESVTTSFGMSAALWNAGNRNRLGGDFNGDGATDLLLQAGSSTDGTLLLLADGSGGFVDQASITTAFGMSASNWNAENRELVTGWLSAKDRDGRACDRDTDCLSAFCTDGVCCESVCDATCYTCNQGGLEGTCTQLTAGTDDGVDCSSGDGDCAGEDADGDHFVALDCGGDDCDDSAADVYPGADETCGDGIDQDCDGRDESCDTDEPPERETGAGDSGPSSASDSDDASSKKQGCGRCGTGSPTGTMPAWLLCLGFFVIARRRSTDRGRRGPSPPRLNAQRRERRVPVLRVPK